MRQFPFDESKAANVVLYITQKLGGRVDFHKLFKIIYFADQKHLVQFGRPVLGDRYIKMPHGPVPSNVYNAVKSVKSPSPFYNFESFEESIVVRGMIVSSEQEPDLSELSRSDIMCLDDSIMENKDLTFLELRNKSHGQAYNDCQDDQISISSIAKEGGANDDMIKYIYENIADTSLFKPCPL